MRQMRGIAIPARLRSSRVEIAGLGREPVEVRASGGVGLAVPGRVHVRQEMRSRVLATAAAVRSIAVRTATGLRAARHHRGNAAPTKRTRKRAATVAFRSAPARMNACGATGVVVLTKASAPWAKRRSVRVPVVQATKHAMRCVSGRLAMAPLMASATQANLNRRTAESTASRGESAAMNVRGETGTTARKSVALAAAARATTLAAARAIPRWRATVRGRRVAGAHPEVTGADRQIRVGCSWRSSYSAWSSVATVITSSRPRRRLARRATSL